MDQSQKSLRQSKSQISSQPAQETLFYYTSQEK